MELRKKVILNLILSLLLLIISAGTVQAASLFDNVNIRSTNVFTMETLGAGTYELTEYDVTYSHYDDYEISISILEDRIEELNQYSTIIVPEYIGESYYIYDADGDGEVGDEDDLVHDFDGDGTNDCSGYGPNHVMDVSMRGLTNVRSISLPSTLFYLNGYSFGGCTSLSEISIYDGILHSYDTFFSVDGIVYEVLSENDKTASVVVVPPELAAGIGGYVTKNGTSYRVTNIKEDAFYQHNDTTGLGYQEIPETIETVEYNAFEKAKFTEVRIAAQEIRSYAFQDCIDLNTVYFENNEIILPLRRSICRLCNGR